MVVAGNTPWHKLLSEMETAMSNNERSEYAPRDDGSMRDKMRERVEQAKQAFADKKTPPEEVANWIVHMPYIHLKGIAIGLLEQVDKEKPPTTYQDFVEILHTWAVGIVDPAEPRKG